LPKVEPQTQPATHSPHRRTAFIRLLERERDELDRLSSSPLHKALEAGAEQLQHEEAAPPTDKEDARRRVFAAIVRREGQRDFRLALLKAYSGRCAVTGCDAMETLEAAHISPYLGPASNVVQNGLLLRADIHTLFDLDLLTIDPATRQVVLSEQLSGMHYQCLSGIHLADPQTEAERPSQSLLTERWDRFQENEKAM
jgi:putative restriction endonuclease